MFVRYSSYILLFNFIYHYYDFFLWYLGDQSIQIEYAYYKGMYAFTSALIFIIYIHVLFFPKNKLDTPRIPSFPPLIMLFSLNFGLLIGVYNLYIIQLYKLPEFLDLYYLCIFYLRKKLLQKDTPDQCRHIHETSPHQLHDN